MKVRPWAELRTDLPSDQIDDEHDIVQFGGRGVAEAIGGLLAAQGYEVSQPEYAGEHGWEFDFHALERRFWRQVTETDRILLLCIDMTSSPFGAISRKPPHPAYVEVMTLLDRELANDPRFHDLAWYFEDEVARDLPGSLSLRRWAPGWSSAPISLRGLASGKPTISGWVEVAPTPLLNCWATLVIRCGRHCQRPTMGGASASGPRDHASPVISTRWARPIVCSLRTRVEPSSTSCSSDRRRRSMARLSAD